MHLTARATQSAWAGAGFSLLEVVIAAALLLMTITAVTVCVASVSRAEAHLVKTMDRDRATRLVAERLTVLPFCAGSYPQAGASTGDGACDLVAAVFPHACSAQNTAKARYVAAGGDGEPAGSFVTLLSEDGVQVTCVARFLAPSDGSALGPDDLGGWDAVSSAVAPAPTLSVELSVGGEGRCVTLVRSALTAAPIGEPPATGGAR